MVKLDVIDMAAAAGLSSSVFRLTQTADIYVISQYVIK